MAGDIQEVVVVVTDPTQTQAIPVGKQWSGEPREDMLRFIMYTSTSGIWQTVWLEPVVEEEVVDTRGGCRQTSSFLSSSSAMQVRKPTEPYYTPILLHTILNVILQRGVEVS